MMLSRTSWMSTSRKREEAIAQAPASREAPTFCKTSVKHPEEAEGHSEGIPPSKNVPNNPRLPEKILQLFEQEKTDELVFRRTPLVIANYMRGWQMHVPQGLPIGTDPRAFLENVCPQIRQKLTENVLVINGVKFQLALMIQLRKDNPDGSEEYTDPVLRHKQEAVIQTDKMRRGAIQGIPQHSGNALKMYKEARCGLLIE